ncbi:uncharacterized protein K460DRAFT_340032 [Cucurbitaria berberidis CBS 394.84]|uniref:Uncharacterized protein n=1 Tax=Cucurbitaria berberidis CBS 394.84 TaxID=1168544 RepID=A0A9P4GC90_9PLEO|nr:uncharacterized protein K460DRAFT_340032 [Cucurbitaria berberidis CBS 394.84]KAF1842696.1 hypothetical protein K460DRAFT_340032 [Cucurbitaria berberidis CBS 394.84]
MAKAAADSAKGVKMFSADTVAAVLMSTGTTSLSMKNYELMSSLDGTKTASGFQHDFRSVLAKAKELKSRVDDGEPFEPVQPAKKRVLGGLASPATPRKRKAAGASDKDETPSKKKATPKARGKKVADPVEEPMSAMGSEGFPEDADAFIKGEQDWEQGFT